MKTERVVMYLHKVGEKYCEKEKVHSTVRNQAKNEYSEVFVHIVKQKLAEQTNELIVCHRLPVGLISNLHPR